MVSRCLHRLRLLLNRLDGRRYSEDVDSFFVQAYVDGDISCWGVQGVRATRHQSKARIVYCSIGVPRSAWEDRTPGEVRVYLADQFRVAFRTFVARLHQKKLTIAEAEFLRDTDAALDAFIADEISYDELPSESVVRRSLLRLEEARSSRRSSQSSEVLSKATPTSRLFSACRSGNKGSVVALLESGVDPNARDHDYLTGLMWASRKGRVEVAEILLNHGADINVRDKRGRTALFHGVCFARVEVVECLAKNGADLSPVDVYGWSPLDMARKNIDHPSKRMIALLERLGAVAHKT
jgi:hypothetical protein